MIYLRYMREVCDDLSYAFFLFNITQYISMNVFISYIIVCLKQQTIQSTLVQLHIQRLLEFHENSKVLGSNRSLSLFSLSWKIATRIINNKKI